MTIRKAEFEHLLGTMSDKALSQLLKISTATIYRWRKEKHVKPFKLNSRWNPVVKWTPELDALLGTMSDPQLADKLGCKSFHIKERRKKLGIPKYNGWTEEDFKLLGTMSDKDAAKQMGRTITSVQAMRQRLNIPSYKSRKYRD